MRKASWKQRLKFGLFTMLPALILAGSVEIGLRLAELDRPKLSAPMLVCESAGLHRADQDLFWTLRPNLNQFFQNVWITTNSLGLRSPEVGDKEPREFRILSLGESTTFGAGVLAKGTYSAQLERNLEEVDLHHVYTVINAGVSAYSSFQSLKYLELRGLRLKPDLVLFYHEYNDSLETIGRDGGPKDEASLAATDMQLYQSRRNSLHRALLARSATYRFITYLMARHRIERPSVTAHPVIDDDGKPVSTELPVRVAPAERRQILEQLHELCEKNRIALVVIHPSYRDSDRHRCILTNVCADHHVPMFEAYDSLHPSDADVKDLYQDDVHPNVIGHARLARDLCSFLVDAGLVPITDETRPTR